MWINTDDFIALFDAYRHSSSSMCSVSLAPTNSATCVATFYRSRSSSRVITRALIRHATRPKCLSEFWCRFDSFFFRGSSAAVYATNFKPLLTFISMSFLFPFAQNSIKVFSAVFHLAIVNWSTKSRQEESEYQFYWRCLLAGSFFWNRERLNGEATTKSKNYVTLCVSFIDHATLWKSSFLCTTTNSERADDVQKRRLRSSP
jgi:hypothetical protein